MRKFKKVSLGLAVVLIAATGVFYFSASNEIELSPDATTAVRRKLPGKAAKTKAVPVVRPGKALTTKKALQESPKPARPAGGEIIAYRSAVLPPKKKGEATGELREWLIRPKTGYAIHLEEHWRPDVKGEMKLAERREYAANQVLLTLDASVDFAAFQKAMAAKGATVKEPLMDVEKGGRIVAVIVPEVSFEAAANLQELIRAYDGRINPELDHVVSINRVPSDARYGGLWGMKQIEAPEAWELGVAATNVTVAVMDTGVNYYHEGLTDNVGRDTENLPFPWINGYRSIGGKESNDPMDDNGHGTHCAGTIAGRGDNGIGVAGVAWITNIKPVKFLNEEGKGFSSDTIRGYRYIRDTGADFVNCSFGGGGYSGAAETAIRQLRILGVTLACAAGNGDENGNGLDNDANPHYPSSYDLENIVAVASSGPEDILSEFSNYGTNSVDIAAPGEGILSTCWSFRGADKCYETLDGTSMATPHVAGALALLRGKYPDDHYRQTIQRLLLNGDKVEALSEKVSTGMRINLRKAMLSLIPPAPTATATAGVYEDRVEVSWKPVGGATYYKLWRAWSEEPENKEPLTDWIEDCSFVDRTAELKMGYHYYVKASKHADGADSSPYSWAAVGYKLTPILDDWDPKDDAAEKATVITPTAETQTHGGHSLSRWDDCDWYRIEMAAGYTYRLESTGSGDVAAELYTAPNTNETSRLAFDDDSGEDYNFRIVYTPKEDEVTYLRVRNVHAGTEAFYQFKYNIVGWTDEYDPKDDTADGATELMPDETTNLHGLHALSAADEYDLFKFELEAGKTYVFSSTGDTDTFGELYFDSLAAGNLAAWNDDGHVTGDDSPLNFRIVYTPVASGTYYLKVKLASSGGSAGTYRLAYVRQADAFDFAFTDDDTCEYVMGWQLNPFFAAEEDATSGRVEFKTDESIFLKWAFNEVSGREVAGTVTNLVEIFNADGVRIVWGHAVIEAIKGDEFVDFTTEFPPLPASGYTAKMTLNYDVEGVSALKEAVREDNVKIIGFTVTDADNAVTGLEITGASTIGAKTSAKYSCVATLADGSTMDVQPKWCVFEGEEYATIAADGTLSANAVAEAVTVRLRAVICGQVAFKIVTITPSAKFTEEPFPDPVLYPSEAMTVKAKVFIDGVSAVEGDQVAAYVGPQVRGRAKVSADGSVTIPVSVAERGEAVTFKVWDASAGDEGAVLACAQAIYGVPGSVYDDLTLTAFTDDPFGVPVVGGDKTNGWKPGTIHAKVTINGAPADTGDVLAVYDGERLVGKAFITRQASFGGDEGIAYCVVQVNLSEKADLSFVVWDRSAEKRCGVAATMEMHKNGDVLGSEKEPVLIAADDRTQMTLKIAKPGWQLVSFNVLPDVPTVEKVLGGLEGFKGIDPQVERLEIGAAYWLHVTEKGASIVVSGRGDETKELELKAGWNLVGYTLPRAGRIEDVLRKAFVAGLITEVTDDKESYPFGSLTTMHPGAGYWVYAPRACKIAFQKSGMLTATGAGTLVYGPFGNGDDIVREPVKPTRFVEVKVKYGAKKASYGDCVALYDDDGALRALGRVEDENGTASFPIFASSGIALTAKVWNSADGSGDSAIRIATANKSLVTPAPGTKVEDVVLTVDVESISQVIVTFDLGEKGYRIGGGELTQKVALGASAIAPQISCESGFVFDHWSDPFTDVRSDVTVRAVYRDVSAPPSMPTVPPAPERKVNVTFNANGGTGEMIGREFDFDKPSEKIESSSFTKDGETFIGWSTTPNGPVVVGDAANVGNIAAALGAVSGDVTLYAQWASAGFNVAVGTFVANGGSHVTVPVMFDSARKLSCVNVRLTYDPKVLALIKVGEGTLRENFADDFTVSEPTLGTVSIGLFADGDVIPGKGTVALLTFAVREGTERLFSDVTIADVQLGEQSGVKDVTAGNPVKTVNGMVRVMASDAAVQRLEGAQTVVADTTLGSIKLETGDAIQASDAQTPITVSGAVTGLATIPVAAPVNGWAGGRYALLKTPTTGLSFTLEGVEDAVFSQEVADGVTTYYATIAMQGEVPVVCEGEEISAGTANQIRKLLGDRLAGMIKVNVSGPKGLIGVIADMGIAPKCTIVGTTLNAVYSTPEIRITSFEPDTGIVRIKVTPGEGNAIVSEIATGYLHVYGTDDLAKAMVLIDMVGYDLTPYLKEATKGEAVLNVTLGTHTFLKVKVER